MGTTFGLYTCSALANDGYGPLNIYSQSPLQTNVLAPQIRSGFSLHPDQYELYGSATISSVWAITASYELDYYQNQLSMGGKWQLNSDWQLDVQYRWNFAANNHLDKPTMAFHDMVGIDQNGRAEADRHRFVIDMPAYGVQEANFNGQTLGSAITSYLQYQAYSDESHGVSFGLSLYYNDTSNGLFSASRFEQSGQINYGYINDKHAFDTSLAITLRETPTDFESMPFRSSTWTFGASYRYQWFEHHTLIAQLTINQGLLDDTSEFSKPTTEFVYGYRYTLKNSAVELTVVENMFHADNSTDIALGLAFRYRFGANA
ncbi:outer membrane beta-barrel domain protein [Vibrio galatheae]|uniref:Outer membrane beta-barrel domain protein n=1 Tax=Vibrio galatheae TaxID=579748 RepID=A0A0F4NK48_9VIBR|nr:outer membrane beta-barrel domain protein [Vibrio galatheae]